MTSRPWVGSLAGRLAFLLAALIVLGTVAVVIREYEVGERREVEAAAEALAARAELAADRLVRSLAERERLVSLWAHLETSQDLAVDDIDKRVSLSLTDLAAMLDYGTEAVAGRDGTVLSASDPGRLEGLARSTPPAFVLDALRGGEDGLRVVGQPDAGAMMASADVRSQTTGEVVGRIVVWEPLSAFLGAAIPLELGTVELTTAGGTILWRGADIDASVDAYLWGDRAVSTAAGELVVRVGRARVEISEQARRSRRQLFTLATVFLVLALPAMFLVVHSTTSGLGRLTRAAEELDPHDPAPLPVPPASAPHEVRVLAQAIEGMVGRLRGAREELARAESLAAIGVLTKSLAHEIRTPLSVLRAGVEVLQRSLESDREREVGGMLQAEIQRLSRLVDDLLIFGRPSRPARLDMDLGQTCRAAVDALAGDAAQKGVSVSFEGDPVPLVADPDQLRQVAVNLITNAVRACERGGSVVVRSSRVPEGAVMEVQDDGAGIPPERLEEIWKPLVTTYRSGNGLGLPIVRQLVEAHGGTVEVDSEVGRGTRMRVMLPIDEETEAA